MLTVLGNSRSLKNSVVKAIEASLQRFAGLKVKGGTLIELVYVVKSYRGRMLE
jgi:hypothetical protein